MFPKASRSAAVSRGSSAEGMTSTAAFFRTMPASLLSSTAMAMIPIATLLNPKQGHHLLSAGALFSVKGGAKVLVFGRFAGIVVRGGKTFLVGRHIRGHAYSGTS